jgi:TatD DNase family protein
MLIDSHAHLYSERFDRDRDKIIRELKDDGIELVILPGASIESSIEAVSLAAEYDNLYATIGVHPSNSDEMDCDSIETLRNLAGHSKVVAIGECGLDYHYENYQKEVQKKWFIEQIRLAKELALPVVVHDRDANIDTYNILKKEQDGNLTGILHCYSGDLELAKKYIDMGFYISIAGPVTYRSARKLQEVAKEVPLEYLLIETDSPYLTPSDLDRKRNQPSYVRYVAGTIAQLRKIPFEKVEIQTNKNTKKIFKIDI